MAALKSPLARTWYHTAPVLAVVAVLIVVWYAGAAYLNAPQVIERQLADQPNWGLRELLPLTWNMGRPVLPAPHQVVMDLWSSIVDWPLDSPRSLLFHTGVTAASTFDDSCTKAGFGTEPTSNSLVSPLVPPSGGANTACEPPEATSVTAPVMASLADSLKKLAGTSLSSRAFSMNA